MTFTGKRFNFHWGTGRGPCALLLLLLFFGAHAGQAQDNRRLSGTIACVVDGDSMTVRDDSGGVLRKIRLYGVDCPEWNQAGGRAATRFSRSLAFASKVDAEVMDADPYGRTVVVLTLQDGRILNEELLKNGHAWFYAAHCKSARCPGWRKLEAGARMRNAGIWRDKKPVPPWRWRFRRPR